MSEREIQQQNAGENAERHGEHAEPAHANGGNFTSKGPRPPVQSGFSNAGPSASDRAYGRGDNDLDLRDNGDLDAKDDAERRRDQRFDNDAILDEIAAGTTVIKSGDTGRAVTKLQVALLDIGYLKGRDVDGDFRDVTEKALKKYQGDNGVGPTGEFDAATLDALRTKFGTRKPYVALSKDGQAGVHRLQDYEKA